jgi:hypothetical protein
MEASVARDTVHTPYQHLVVAGWLAALRYKPGSRIEAFLDFEAAVIRVSAQVMVFDSTRPAATNVLRGHSIRVPMPSSSHQDLNQLLPVERTYYDAGPDLVAGPLVKVGQSVELPPHIGVPQDQAQLAQVGHHAEAVFRGWLRAVLRELESHEVDEWLQDKATGKPLFDPHAKEAP